MNMQNWEKGTPLSRLVKNEERSGQQEGLTFAEKAEQFREKAERIVHAEKLATLARGFLTGCGGVNNVTEDTCVRFVNDHRTIVWNAMDDVPEDERPAAVYALVLTVAKKVE